MLKCAKYGFVVLTLFNLMAINARADVWGYSGLYYYPDENTVNTWASTSFTYSESVYYIIQVSAYLYANNSLVGSGYNVGSSSGLGVGVVIAAQQNTTYKSKAYFDVNAFYFSYNYPNYGFLDYYNYYYWGDNYMSYPTYTYACACGPPTYQVSSTYSTGYIELELFVPCQYPTAETSELINMTTMQFNGQTHYGGYFMAKMLENNAAPANGKYAGRKMRELFDVSDDECYRENNGPIFLPTPAPSPDVALYQDNSYLDFLGATYEWIDYYTHYSAANCWMQVMQAMHINECANPSNFIPIDYHMNVYGIRAPNQWIYGVGRANASGLHSWPW